MTTLDNLRTRKLQLEQHLAQCVGEEGRERIEGELNKIDIALSLPDEVAKPPSGRPSSKQA